MQNQNQHNQSNKSQTQQNNSVEDKIYNVLENNEKPEYSVLFKAHAELDRQNALKQNSAFSQKPPKKSKLKRRHIFAFATSFSIVILLAISLPLGIIYGGNYVGCADGGWNNSAPGDNGDFREDGNGLFPGVNPPPGGSNGDSHFGGDNKSNCEQEDCVYTECDCESCED